LPLRNPLEERKKMADIAEGDAKVLCNGLPYTIKNLDQIFFS
jgi:hypothetical protein